MINSSNPEPLAVEKISILARTFFDRSPLIVGREIIGKKLVRVLPDGTDLTGTIVEVEAYGGNRDPASHAYHGKTKRNEVMFGEAGRAYVYFTYGFHNCLNFVTSSKSYLASAVLIRAVAPLTGIDIMAKNRKTNIITQLASGPGKVCQAFQIDRSLNGVDVTSLASPIQVADEPTRMAVRRSVRVGIKSAIERKWRFYAAASPHVSRVHLGGRET